MAITAELPTGFIGLTSPVPAHARQLLLMIAHAAAFQVWAGVSRWQDACRFLDVCRAEVETTEQGQRISNPNVLLSYQSQDWSQLDTDRVMFRGCQFDLYFTATAEHDSLDLSFAEFSERCGRVIAEIGQMSGGYLAGDSRSWPVIEMLTESQAPQFDEVDGIGYWSANWQTKLAGPK